MSAKQVASLGAMDLPTALDLLLGFCYAARLTSTCSVWPMAHGSRVIAATSFVPGGRSAGNSPLTQRLSRKLSDELGRRLSR